MKANTHEAIIVVVIVKIEVLAARVFMAELRESGDRVVDGNKCRTGFDA